MLSMFFYMRGPPPISLIKAQFCQYKILVEIENCRLQS